MSQRKLKAYSTAPSLARDVALPVPEDKLWFPVCQVKQHLGEVAVSPREPGPGVRCRVVNVDRLVDEPEAVRVLPSKW